MQIQVSRSDTKRAVTSSLRHLPRLSPDELHTTDGCRYFGSLHNVFAQDDKQTCCNANVLSPTESPSHSNRSTVNGIARSFVHPPNARCSQQKSHQPFVGVFLLSLSPHQRRYLAEDYVVRSPEQNAIQSIIIRRIHFSKPREKLFMTPHPSSLRKPLFADIIGMSSWHRLLQ